MEPISPAYKLRDWSLGVVSNNANPLAYPAQALLDGENVMIRNKAIVTRPGYSLVSASPVVAGVVRALFQIRFPTNQVSYLLAQVGNKLYVTDDNLPTTTATWTEIYDLGTGSGVVTVTTLNDRAVITEGVSSVPLVFLGCQETDGSDWAVPLTVLLSFDGNGEYYHNINEEVLDNDPDTYEDMQSFPSGVTSPDNFKFMYIRCDVKKASAVYFELGGTGNQTTNTLLMQYYTGSAWAYCPGNSDGTAVGGQSFAQSGVVTFNEVTMGHALVGEVPGYWLRVGWYPGLSADTIYLKRVLFKAPCQELQNIGDGQPDTLAAVLFAVNAAGSDITGQVIDFTNRLTDYIKPTFHYLDDGDLSTPYTMTAGDYLYFGFPDPFTGVLIEPEPTHPNTAISVFGTPQVWDGTAWTNVSGFADLTKNGAGTISLSKKGQLRWTEPTVWKTTRPFPLADYPNGYWMRVSVTAALSARTGLSEVRCYPIERTLKKYKLVTRKKHRVVLANTTAASDQVLISRALQEYGWSGADAYGERVGGQDGIVSLVEIYNQIFLFKVAEGFMLNGTQPGEFSFERAELSAQVPLSQQVCVLAPIVESDDKTKMGFYYLNTSGVYHFTGLQLYRISDLVGWWNQEGSVRVDKDLLYGSVGCYYPELNYVIFAVPLITPTNPSPTTNSHLIVFDLTLKAWLPPFALTTSHGGITSLTSGYEYNANGAGKLGRNGLYAGTSTGYILELFNPSQLTDSGTDIAGFFKTGWLDLESPELVKKIMRVALYGKTSGANMQVTMYRDGDDTAPTDWDPEITAVSSVASNIVFRYGPVKSKPDVQIQGRFFKVRVDMTAYGTVYGIDLEPPDRRHY